METRPQISEVFEHYYPHIEIPSYGTWRKIYCPVHVETRPSASINLGIQRWFCHACDISEDSWAVIQREEGVSFIEAKEKADAWFGGGSPEVPPAVREQPSPRVSGRPRFGGGGEFVPPRVRRRFGDGA